jgi:endonuclease/exonuclease/phosphatase (EEP) superfamily protein YafD
VNRITHSRSSVLAPISFLYASSSIIGELLPHMPATPWWLMEVNGIFGAWFYLPLPLLTATVWSRRNWLAGVWLAVPLVVFARDYGPSFLPSNVHDGDTVLRVMTANVLQDNDDYASLAALLAEQQPDVVAVQELGTAMAASLPEPLRERYPYQALHPAESWVGVGVFSRYPIEAQTAPNPDDGACLCQQVTVSVEGRLATLLNVHLTPPLGVTFRDSAGGLPAFPAPHVHERELSLRMILQRVEANRGPLVVLGDFNTNDGQPFYRLLRWRLADAHRGGGWGFGFTFPTQRDGYPLPFSLIRIDYIFHDESWATRAAWTGNLPGSDHRYVVADLILVDSR